MVAAMTMMKVSVGNADATRMASAAATSDRMPRLEHLDAATTKIIEEIDPTCRDPLLSGSRLGAEVYSIVRDLNKQRERHPFSNSNFCLYQQASRHKMLANTINRFISTVQNKTFGSGMPIESEQEKLLSSSRGNKQLEINVCGKLYADLAREKPLLYGSAPKDKGINFTVHYYDSQDFLSAAERLKAPTVCLLHGAPGHYKDFASLINFLTVRGVRVIAPNFPDYSATFDHCFRHSPRERLEFLLEFFRAIELTKIDLMVGHSSAVYTMFALLNHSLNEAGPSTSRRPQVRSLGLFSTPSHRLPPNLAVTPFRMFTLRLFEYPIFRPVILALIHTFTRLQGIRNRVDRNRIEDLLIAASAVGYSNHEKMADQLKLIHRFQLPVFLLIGTKDRLIPMKCFDELKSDLGVRSEEQVKFYNSDGSLSRGVVEPNGLVEVSEFALGGHYTFQRFSQQVNEDLYAFLRRRVVGGESTRL